MIIVRCSDAVRLWVSKSPWDVEHDSLTQEHGTAGVRIIITEISKGKMDTKTCDNMPHIRENKTKIRSTGWMRA